jgi:hypothetical protein
VTQSRDRFRLDPEPVQVLRPGLDAGPDHLQGNQAVQLLLSRLVDHPHAAVAQLCQDVIAGDRGPNHLAGAFPLASPGEGPLEMAGLPVG